MNGETDPLWQAQDMDSENFRGARLIPKTENRNRKPKSNHGLRIFLGALCDLAVQILLGVVCGSVWELLIVELG
jgi:hypothetical protein